MKAKKQPLQETGELETSSKKTTSLAVETKKRIQTAEGWKRSQHKKIKGSH